MNTKYLKRATCPNRPDTLTTIFLMFHRGKWLGVNCLVTSSLGKQYLFSSGVFTQIRWPNLFSGWPEVFLVLLSIYLLGVFEERPEGLFVLPWRANIAKCKTWRRIVYLPLSNSGRLWWPSPTQSLCSYSGCLMSILDIRSTPGVAANYGHRLLHTSSLTKVNWVATRSQRKS